MPHPSLETARLLLRPFRDGDAAQVERLAGDRAIAEMTLTIPHPYPAGQAAVWIAGHQESWERGEAVVFAVTRPADGAVLGAIGLDLTVEHRRGELGYWIGVPYWGMGYATEAGRAVVRYGLETRDLNRLQAAHYADNPQSGRVLAKLGFREEGRFAQHDLRFGRFRDVVWYGLTRDAYGRQPT